MKKIYLFTMIFALLGMNQAWAETVTFDEANWRGSNNSTTNAPFNVEKTHVTFQLTDYMKKYDYEGWGQVKHYFFLEKSEDNKDRRAKVMWTVDPGYTISVSSIGLNSQTSNKGYVQTSRELNGEQKVCDGSSHKNWHDEECKVGGTYSDLFGSPAVALGNDEFFYLKATSGEWQFKTITLTYSIAINTYTVNYNGNPTAANALSGEMAQQTLTYGGTTALADLAFTNGYSVTFDEQGGSAVEDKNLHSEFLGWATSADGAVAYANQKDFAEELKTTTGVVLNLYAKWGAIPSITLPATEKEGEHFAGWYNGDVKIGVAGTVITPTANMNLVARWTTIKEPHFEGAGQSLKVGKTYDGFTFTNTTTKTPSALTSAKFYYIISDVNVTTDNTKGSPDGSKVIGVEYDGDKTIIKALNQGTAKITFYQADDEEANNIAEGHSATYEFEVEKNTPEFTWPETGTYYFNDTVEHFFWSNQEETAITVDTDKPAIATIVDSALVTYNGVGTARITITQAENYFWAEHSEYRDITPVKKNVNHVPFTMNNTTVRDALYVNKSDKGTISCEDDGRIVLTQGGAAWDANELYYIVHFEGIPEAVSFTYRSTNSMATSYGRGDAFVVYESATGDEDSWEEVWRAEVPGNTDDHDVDPQSLKPNTRYLKFFFHATYTGNFKNIQVTELKQFAAEDVDFEQVLVGSDEVEKELVFKHANAGYNVSVELNEEGETKHFAIDHLTVDNTGGDRWGEEIFVVTYNPFELGEHSATVTFTDLLGNEKVVTISGKTVATIPTGIDETEVVKATKIMRNGQIFIIREGKVYNLQGLRVE